MKKIIATLLIVSFLAASVIVDNNNTPKQLNNIVSVTELPNEH